MLVHENSHYSTLREPKKGWPTNLWEAKDENETIERGGAKIKQERKDKAKGEDEDSEDSQSTSLRAWQKAKRRVLEGKRQEDLKRQTQDKGKGDGKRPASKGKKQHEENAD